MTRIEEITPALNALEAWLADFESAPGASEVPEWLAAYRELRLMRVQLDERIRMAEDIYIRPLLSNTLIDAAGSGPRWALVSMLEMFDRPVGDLRKL